MQEQTGMLVEPDFNDVKDSVGPGIYKVRVLDSKVDQWQGKDGKPNTTYINWTMETFGESDDKNNGRRIFHKTPINGAGAFRLKDFYKAAMGEEVTGAFDRSMLYGKEIEVTVVDGKMKTGELTGYTEVKAVKPLKHS